MPIMIGRINRERTLTGLARNVFRIEGRGSGERLRQAEEALLRANPWLVGPQGFQRGVTFIVPDVSGLRASARVRTPEASTAEQVLGQLEERLQDLSRETKATLEASSQRAKQTLKNLSSSGIRKAIEAAAPDLKEQLPEITKNAKTRAKQVAQRSAAVTQVLNKAIQDVDSLRKNLR